MPIKIAMVEDIAALRTRFEELFRFYKDIKVVAVYGSGESALNGLKRLPPSKLPDIVLMDIELPQMSGIETMIEMKELFPTIDVMMITVFEDEQKIFQSIQAGASGYLLKDDPSEEIVEAVRSLFKGGAPMSPHVAKKILDFTRGQIRPNITSAANEFSKTEFELTERERELLLGLVNGETYTSLAKLVFISPLTVKTHIKNIYKKLHVHSRAHAVRVALEKHLV